MLHGRWLGHPLHAAATDVPVGAWATAVVLDGLGAIRKEKAIRRGADLAIYIGLAGASVAALSGLADYSHTDGAARRVGFLHGISNVVVTSLFIGSAVARKRGWQAEMSYPHWLAKIYNGDEFIDLIFNSGNGLTPVGDRWFRNNAECDVLGVPVRIANAEDGLLSKAFIMERERYDGADVAHLIQANAERLDWPGLLERFGPHWRVQLAHLTLFGFIYPGERHRVPRWLMETLLGRLATETRIPAEDESRVCAGTLLSREQYLHDVERLGYVDGRLTAASTMTEADVAVWTEAIPGRAQPCVQPPPSAL